MNETTATRIAILQLKNQLAMLNAMTDALRHQISFQSTMDDLDAQILDTEAQISDLEKLLTPWPDGHIFQNGSDFLSQ